MPTSPFDRALAWVLKAEGGYYDGTGKHDPNPTMCGITQRTYDRYRVAAGKDKRPVRQIGMDEIASIYRTLYWTKGKCDKLAEKSETIATIHMDACVNHGVASPNNNRSSGAIELFQRAVGVEDDGVFGPKTMGAFLELMADDGEEAVANRYLKAREAQYRYLAERAPNTLGLNLRGWLRRLEHLKKHLKLVVLLVAAMTTITATVSAQSRYSYPAVMVEEVNPPTAWEVIYHEVEKCVGMKPGKFRAIRWFVTPAPWGPEGNQTWGLWHQSGGHPRIIVSAYDTSVVRHEALHDVLWRNGFREFRVPADSSNNPEHPSPPFGTCAKRSFP